MRTRAVVAMAMVSALGLPMLSLPSHAQATGWPSPAAGLTQSGDPEVIFTFDDGPNPRTTDKVLDILAAHRIQAVFFLVGWRFERGDVAHTRRTLDRMLDEGHLIANHTITHAQLCGLEPAQIDREVAGARDILEHAAAMRVPWFRTPYGAYCNRLLEALGRNGVNHFHWDIDPQEWQGKSAKSTAAYVIRQLARLEGRAVLLMHDTKAATVAALPEILNWITTENARRATIGRRQIRILSGPEVAAEQSQATLAWLTSAVAMGGTRVRSALAATVP